MRQVYEWEVQLALSGPISVAKPLRLEVEKGRSRPFATTVAIKKHQDGITVELTVRASNQTEANGAAVSFIGQMVDLLCLWIDLPLHLSFYGNRFKPLEDHTRRLIDHEEWSSAFRLSREYSIARPSLTRALSWFRKGITSEDPIDKLLALWSALEGIGAKHARPSQRTAKGAINQICDCFEQLWGDKSHWKIISEDAEFINLVHEKRSGISHGFITADLDTFLELSDVLPRLRDLTQSFLFDWEKSDNLGYRAAA